MEQFSHFSEMAIMRMVLLGTDEDICDALQQKVP